ncbi:hypothetical protein BgiBS90_020068, partial [Biomphalaria glabrata]
QNECQESEGKAEDHLRELYKNCTKNPGHPQFIRIKELKMEHLPEAHRNSDLFALIKAVADLTVRISVDMVSPNRPKYWPNTTVHYPFYGQGGTTKRRTGTGEIHVWMYDEGCGYNCTGQRYNPVTGGSFDVNYTTCPCETCQHSDTPSSVWWMVHIHTAAHVVYDEIEASYTSCRFFFDDEDRGGEKFIIDKVSVFKVHFERDRCVLKFVTCDERLGERLYQIAGEKTVLETKVYKKYKTVSSDKLTFIVSHPHGCSKQVSVGKWVKHYVQKMNEYDREIDLTKFSYTTCTCPGSSGASIYCVGLATTHVHNGGMENGLNYSSVDLFHRV